MRRFLQSGHRPDYFLLAIVFVLVVFGLAMLASASSNLGKLKFNDSYYYLTHQIYYGLSVGVAGFLAGYLISYKRLKTFALPLLLVSLVALGLVFTQFGLEIRNTTRWLKLGPVSFQPSELIKLTFIVYLAAWLSNQKMMRERRIAEGLVPFLVVSAAVAGLLFFQPATSTVVVILSAGLVVYLVSGARLKYILIAVLLGAIALAVVIYATPYRRARIMGFLDTQRDLQGQNYHVNQALTAIASGGLTGRGYGQSTTKVHLLPAPIDDSIFAIIAEELGFIGAGSLLVLFAMLTVRLLWLAKEVRDRFGKLLLVGFGTTIAFQSLTNMGAISGLIPLTGVPLPFISYGGTALAVFLTMMGIAANVSRYA